MAVCRELINGKTFYILNALYPKQHIFYTTDRRTLTNWVQGTTAWERLVSVLSINARTDSLHDSVGDQNECVSHSAKIPDM
jgi:hypothetical protein